MDVGAHIIVTGLVQGVGFRWFVEREAKKLGLTGYVKNLYTGEVEVIVEGDRGMIEELIDVLRVGNRASRVVDVRVTWRKFENKYHDFRIAF
ncbi:MAG: acylphosphatase [candidate division KSB1 bacterium]|nr:acylphosphatase [candidate division KSB1 bacterium]